MPSYVVKATREPDSLYLVWSTIVDAPTWIGNRDALLDHLHNQSTDPSNPPEARVARADTTGTSCLIANPTPWYGWDDAEFVVSGDYAPAGYEPPPWMSWVLPRDRLADYARALLDGDEARAASLLVGEPDGEAP